MELRYAGTGVPQGFRWSRVHGQRGDFGDGIPGGGADSYGERQRLVSQLNKTGKMSLA